MEQILAQEHIKELLQKRSDLTDQILRAIGVELDDFNLHKNMRAYYEELLSKNGIIRSVEDDIDQETADMEDEEFNSRQDRSPSEIMNLLRTVCDPNMAKHPN